MKLTRAETARWLFERDHFCILTHRRPDGDTLGTAALLCLGLQSLGKQAYILENPEITEKYRPLHEGLTRTAVADGDTVVCVDVASQSMLLQAFSQLSIALRIDHHGSPTSFTAHELVDPAAGACGEIVYDVLTEMGVTLDKPMAKALYTAVSTDTGRFCYANTTAHSFRTAAACADTGADLHSINQALFETNSYAKLRLHGWMAENTRLVAGGAVAVCALPLSVEQALGVTEDDMENISGFPRSIAGVQMAATLRQTADGKVKISVRALPAYDAAKVCEAFGGGGHRGAAGCTVNSSLEEAAAAVEKVMLQQLG